MAKAKRSEDDYIQLNKKITDRQQRKIIFIVADEWGMTPAQVCYEFIRSRAMIEIKKREQ